MRREKFKTRVDFVSKSDADNCLREKYQFDERKKILMAEQYFVRFKYIKDVREFEEKMRFLRAYKKAKYF